MESLIKRTKRGGYICRRMVQVLRALRTSPYSQLSSGTKAASCIISAMAGTAGYTIQSSFKTKSIRKEGRDHEELSTDRTFPISWIKQPIFLFSCFILAQSLWMEALCYAMSPNKKNVNTMHCRIFQALRARQHTPTSDDSRVRPYWISDMFTKQL